MARTALYDACVLYPAPLRDLLVQLASTGLFRARWTEAIHKEWIRGVLRSRPDLNEDSLRRVADAMNRHVDGCLVVSYEHLIPAVTLPDDKDRHVAAAAMHGGADVIVTFNLRDFPAAALAPLGIAAQHPDLFVRRALDLGEAAVAAIQAVRRRLSKPPKTADEYLATLARQGLPETVAFLRKRMADI